MGPVHRYLKYSQVSHFHPTRAESPTCRWVGGDALKNMLAVHVAKRWVYTKVKITFQGRNFWASIHVSSLLAFLVGLLLLSIILFQCSAIYQSHRCSGPTSCLVCLSDLNSWSIIILDKALFKVTCRLILSVCQHIPPTMRCLCRSWIELHNLIDSTPHCVKPLCKTALCSFLYIKKPGLLYKWMFLIHRYKCKTYTLYIYIY